MSDARKRWLPTMIDWTERQVSWIDFGRESFDEPFFSETIWKLRSMEPPRQEGISDLATLVGVASCLRPVTPAGLVFHISRCGSTVVANALRTFRRVCVLSEPPAMVDLFMPRRGLTADLSGILQCLARVFGNDVEERVRPLVIKWTSWNLLSLPLVRSIWPDVPCIVMIRDPIEVMQSHLTSPSGWNELKESTLAFNLFGAEFASAPQMASEEYYARIIGKLCVAVKTSVDDKCIVLDYSNLNPNSVLEIGSVMGLGGPVDLQAFEQVFAVHGKYPGQRFQPDREEKQRAVSFQTRSAADRWANEDYRALGSWSSGAE